MLGLGADSFRLPRLADELLDRWHSRSPCCNPFHSRLPGSDRGAPFVVPVHTNTKTADVPLAGTTRWNSRGSGHMARIMTTTVN
ncbi:hypothetical protein D516_0981 [Rhodobacter sp. AKP1]|nr:hypothetical protein D516_0981 [Rhodobacter sp. AKP1]